MVRGIDRGGGGIDRGWGGHERSGGERGGGGEAPTSEEPAPSEGRAAARWRAAVTEARREAAAAAAAAEAAAAAAARTAAPSCLGERSGGRRRSSSLLSAFEPGIPCHCDRRAREQRSRARRHSRRARDLRGVGSPEGSGLLGRRPAARKDRRSGAPRRVDSRPPSAADGVGVAAAGARETRRSALVRFVRLVVPPHARRPRVPEVVARASSFRPRDGVGHVVGRNSGAASRGTSLLALVV